MTHAARLAGVTRALIWWYLRQFGLDELPARLREEQKAKFAIPKWSEFEKARAGAA